MCLASIRKSGKVTGTGVRWFQAAAPAKRPGSRLFFFFFSFFSHPPSSFFLESSEMTPSPRAEKTGPRGPSTSRILHSHVAAEARSDISLSTPGIWIYVRCGTNSHDVYMTRSGCWLIDERTGTGQRRGG